MSTNPNGVSNSVNNPSLKKTNMAWPNIYFFSMVGPYVLIGFFILLSIFNTNIKGIFYVIGLIVVLFFSNIVNTMLPADTNITSKAMCSAFGFSSLLNDQLPFGIIVYTYTFIYLFIPMIQNFMMNFSLIFSLFMIIGADILIQFHSGCARFPAIIMSIISAIVIGMGWVILISNIMPSMLYSTDYISDKQVCSMPSEQKFKCKVYKNGELISTVAK